MPPHPFIFAQAIPTCACMALSVTYHTFMNCICCYRRLLLADVLGIWVTMFFGFSVFYLQSCPLPHAPWLKAAFTCLPPPPPPPLPHCPSPPNPPYSFFFIHPLLQRLRSRGYRVSLFPHVCSECLCARARHDGNVPHSLLFYRNRGCHQQQQQQQQ
jgi:hypothetical protein